MRGTDNLNADNDTSGTGGHQGNCNNGEDDARRQNHNRGKRIAQHP